MNKETKKLYKPSSNGRFGKFGGKFVPETLMSSLKEIENAFDEISKDQSFWDELILLQRILLVDQHQSILLKIYLKN